MPMKPPRICSCGKIVPSNVICLCQQRRRIEADKRRPNATDRGYDSAWRKARSAYLAKHSFCAMCAAQGVTIPATVVDHIRPHRGNKALFWDPNNWQPLCAPHHNGAKQSQDHQADRTHE